MPSFIKSVTFDCHDPQRVAAFWAEALGSLEAERERLIGLGATLLAALDDLVVMADPEGNEFCLED